MSTIFVFAGCLEKIVIWLTWLLPQVQGRSYVYASEHLLPWKESFELNKKQSKEGKRRLLEKRYF